MWMGLEKGLDMLSVIIRIDGLVTCVPRGIPFSADLYSQRIPFSIHKQKRTNSNVVSHKINGIFTSVGSCEDIVSNIVG